MVKVWCGCRWERVMRVWIIAVYLSIYLTLFPYITLLFSISLSIPFTSPSSSLTSRGRKGGGGGGSLAGRVAHHYCLSIVGSRPPHAADAPPRAGTAPPAAHQTHTRQAVVVVVVVVVEIVVVCIVNKHINYLCTPVSILSSYVPLSWARVGLPLASPSVAAAALPPGVCRSVQGSLLLNASCPEGRLRVG